MNYYTDAVCCWLDFVLEKYFSQMVCSFARPLSVVRPSPNVYIFVGVARSCLPFGSQSVVALCN